MSNDPTLDAVAQQAADTAFILRVQPQIGEIVLDCSVNETHVAENEMTDHPVEVGFDVTDHVRQKPDALTIEGIVSNTPLSHQQRTRTLRALGIEFDSAAAASYILGQPGYAEQAYQALRAMRDSGELVKVITSLRTYENMAITSLVVPRNKDTGDALRFTMQLRRVRIVQNKLTVATRSLSPGKKVSNGKQAAKGADAATKKKSIWYEGREGVRKLGQKFDALVGGGG